jgi:hypothetical protein
LNESKTLIYNFKEQDWQIGVAKMMKDENGNREYGGWS